MALASCRECGHKVSDEADACPSCGIKRPVIRTKLSTWIIGGVVLLVIVSAAVQRSESPAPPPSAPTAPTQAPAKPSRADEFKTLTAAAIVSLRQSMRNPASFQLATVIRTYPDVACITYRAQNGFGGMNVSTAVLNESGLHAGEDGAAKAWGGYCAGRPGPDITADVARIVALAGSP